MKKIVSTIVLLMGVLVASTQINITTTGFNACGWNPETEKYELECYYDDNTSARFEFNKNETMFVHTTPEMTSSYYVDSTNHQLDEGRELWIYFVTSDIGNKYIYFFDVKFNEVRAMPMDGSYIIWARLKRLWSDSKVVEETDNKTE